MLSGFKASFRQWDRDHKAKWLNELRTAIESTSGSVSRETLVVFCESIDRLNDGLRIIKRLAELVDGPGSESLIDNVAGGIHEVWHLISALADKLDWPHRGETVVSHGGFHARSWSEIVLKNGQLFSFLIENDVIITRESLSQFEYDAGLVAEHLEIEFEKELELWDRRNAAQFAKAEPPKPSESRKGGDETESCPSKGAVNPTIGKRGRKKDSFTSDIKKDQRIAEAWKTGQYSTYAELATAFGMNKDEVKNALDRHRKRAGKRRQGQ